MILNCSGEEFFYEGVCYKIGDKILAVDESDYAGLFGVITEIRDGSDKGTENDTPDIYCSFDVPVLPYDIETLEQKFSVLYQCEKKIENISLDEVIMSPEMILPIDLIGKQQRKLNIYLVIEDWAVDGTPGHSVIPCTDYYTAKHILCEKLMEEQKSGCIPEWSSKDNFQIESGSYYYDCWLDAEYCENHYKIAMAQETLLMSPTTYGMIGRSYIDESRIEDFESQIDQWDALGSFTDEQYEKLIADPSIPERIHSVLSKNDSYWESYWESVSEVAHEIVQKHLKENEEADTNDIL